MILEHYYSDFECDQGVGSGGEETDSEVWDFIDETMVGSQGTSDTDSEEECSSCEVQSTLHPDVRSGDLNRVLKQQRHLNDQEKLYFLLEHSFVPPPEYEFPVRVIGGVARRFQHGLVYSESANGGFCKYCFVFGRCGSTTSELGALKNFKKCEKLVEHFNSKKFHKEAVKVAMMYIDGQKKEVLPIDQQLSSLRKKCVVENRLKLCSIVETLILCGRQGIALRGHRNDQTSVESNPLANHGNFLALLQFCIQAGD